jgi:hypothetical protein
MPTATRRRRLGDRFDGRLLRTLNPFYAITPFIMRTRSDAQDYFSEEVDIDAAETWLHAKRDEGRKDLGFLHLFMAVLVRTISQKPRLNRFVAGQRIYARNEITISLALKKKLNEDSPETTVKIRFEPTDTVFEVAEKINTAVGENKAVEVKNETDNTAKLFMLLPRALLRGAVAILRWMDYHGILPKAIHRASPFHTSAFVTDLGSLGVGPIYHHLYDFGTTSVFVAFGGKLRRRELDRDGHVIERKLIPIKLVNDERICDGHYYASAFRYMLGLFKEPEILERPPERVVEDQE